MNPAQHMHQNRVRPSTVKNYTGKINNIKLLLIKNNHSECVVNDTLIVPLDAGLMEDLFGWLSVDTDIPKQRRLQAVTAILDEDDDIDEEETENIHVINLEQDFFATTEVTMSVQTMQGYKSALIWYYEEHKLRIPAELDEQINVWIRGYKKIVAEKKANGVMSITEGKSSLAFCGYCAIAEEMMKLTPDGNANRFNQGIFCWSFMTLSWNLMARSNSVKSIMLQHIDWRGDAAVITFAKHKGDQTGEGLGNEKYVYANPLNPTICPLLALAVFVFTHHRAPDTRKQQLYIGTKNEDRFAKTLQKVVKDIPTNILGANFKDIGTHSNRKGCASFLLMFCVISAVQVYLRAGWSLGNVPDRYIFAGAGGDQIVGRAASGLPINSKEFATLPPHFGKEHMAELNSMGWQHILEGYNNYPESFKRIVPYLFASIMYHMDFLNKNLDRRHPLWNQKMFTTLLPAGGIETAASKYADCAITGLNNCKDTGMTATGIPQSLAVAIEIENLRTTMNNMVTESAKHKDQIIAALNCIPEKVKQLIMDTFQVNGAVPVTSADVSRLIRDEVSVLANILIAKIDGISGSAATTESSDVPAAKRKRELPTNLFFWKGKYRAVPEHWSFPNENVKTMWGLWHHGNANLGIMPYKKLRENRWYEDLESGTVDLSRASAVMDFLQDTAIQLQFIPKDADISDYTPEYSEDIFDGCYHCLTEYVYGDSNVRSPQVTVSTICNKLYKINARNNTTN